jgi:hypothetical protein
MICNICFLIAVVLRYVEMTRRAKGNFNGAIPFQPLESSLVILGYGAIFVNFIFVLLTVYWILARKIKLIPAWILIFNLIIFPLQVYFFFF